MPNDARLQDCGDSLLDDQLLQPFPAHWLFVASLFYAGVGTVVIIPFVSGFTRTAHSRQWLLAMPAKGLSAQQVFGLWRLRPFARSPAFHFLLSKLKNVFRDNGGYAVLDHNIVIGVDSDIALVLDDLIDAVLAKRLALRSPKAEVVQVAANLRLSFPLNIHVKDDLNSFRAVWLDHDGLVRGGHIPQRVSGSGTVTLKRTLPHTPFDFLAQFRRVVFRKALHKAFEDDPLRAVWNACDCVLDLDAVLPQSVLIDGAVIPITGEAVGLVHDDDLKNFLAAVVDHSLKFSAVVCLARYFPVNVRAHDPQVVLFGILGTNPQLALD